MNLKKLREAEALFLLQYPEGFASEAMEQIRRKHNVDKLSEFAATALAKPRFGNQGQVLDDIVKIVTRSSMVSMFEKPKFRDFVNGMSRDGRAHLATGFRRLLHGDPQEGFADLIDVLSEGKLAKWSLMTICLFHYRPQREVFVKPTTTKNVTRQFELEGLVQPIPICLPNANKSEATVPAARTISRLPVSPLHPYDNRYNRRAISEPSR